VHDLLMRLTLKDCLNLLEKRVKSRFSHRVFRVFPPTTFEEYVAIAKTTLTTPVKVQGPGDEEEERGVQEWTSLWDASVEVRHC
jgi:origin recognition complex subunit 4